MLSPAFLYRPEAPRDGDFNLTVLDVGQGLGLVVRTSNHVLVYDTGPAFRTGRDTGELVIVPYLRTFGVAHIDMLVVSHGDLDHAGGMQTVIKSMRPRRVIAGPSVQVRDYPSETCEIGQRWTWDGVQFEFLHPASPDADSDNNTSCVLRITGPHGSALLTGDIEADAEAELVEREITPADIVVVAHHGSRSSSTEQFVAATHATYAVMSAGYRNRWGFPKKQVTERWSAAGAQVLSTIEGGAIELEVSGTTTVRQYRHDHHRYWSSR